MTISLFLLYLPEKLFRGIKKFSVLLYFHPTVGSTVLVPTSNIIIYLFATNNFLFCLSIGWYKALDFAATSNNTDFHTIK